MELPTPLSVPPETVQIISRLEAAGFEAWCAEGGFSQQDNVRHARDDNHFIPSIDIRTSDACVD